MAVRYQSKQPMPLPRHSNTAAIKEQAAEIYDEPVASTIGEGPYTDLKFGPQAATVTTSSSSKHFGDPQARVVKGKTNVKAIIAITFLITACVILVLFALVMTGVTLSSSQETSKESTRSSALIDNMDDQLTQLKQDFQGQETRLRQEFQATLTAQVTQLRQELYSMHTALAIAQHDLNTSLHSPLHPYQNCHTATAERRMLPATSTTYTRRVNTPYRTINIAGYYTLDIRCHYQISNSSYTVVTQLRQSGSGMYCYCTVYDPDTTSDSLIGLTTSTSFYLDCILSITRCPLAQTIV